MKISEINENPDNIHQPDASDPIIGKIKEPKKSSSDIYHLLWMNSNITGVNVNRETCNMLLSYMQCWKDLPLRIRNRVIDDVLDFMSKGCLPHQPSVEKTINEHPIVRLFKEGTMPPESEHQRRQEDAEREKRESDIEKLRLRTANETRYVMQNAPNLSGWDPSMDDEPTEPRLKALRPPHISESIYRSYLRFENDEEDEETRF